MIMHGVLYARSPVFFCGLTRKVAMKKDSRLKIRLSDQNLKMIQQLMEKEQISLNKALNKLLEKVGK